MLAAWAVALPFATAEAHQASDAHLHWWVDGQTVHERFDIALRDIDRVQALDDDGDGQLTWAELQRHWPAIEALAEAGIASQAEGRRYQPVERAAPALARHGDEVTALLQRRWHCEAPPQALHIRHRLFADADASHRGLARIVRGPVDVTGNDEALASLALVPGAEPVSVALAPGQPQAGDALRRFGGFVAEGMHHIAIGLDHVLFPVTLLMVAVWRRDGGGWAPHGWARSAWREALHLVTAFTVAHSLTLGLAAAGVLAPPSRWVESAIALSVLVAALDNLRPFLPGPRWPVVGLFGLVHGFGFAGPLQDLGLQRGDLALPLLGFNLGVELGQLTLVALLLPVAIALLASTAYRRALVPAGSAVVALLALGWTPERGLGLSLQG